MIYGNALQRFPRNTNNDDNDADQNIDHAEEEEEETHFINANCNRISLGL